MILKNALLLIIMHCYTLLCIKFLHVDTLIHAAPSELDHTSGVRTCIQRVKPKMAEFEEL